MATEITFQEYRNSSVVALLEKLGLDLSDCTQHTYIYISEGDNGFVLEYCEKPDHTSYFPDEIEGAYVSAYEEWALAQVVTLAEITQELGLGASTVRQYIYRHGDELIKSGEAKKADGRTWLILRSTAYRIWGRAR